jgi:peptide/nickel transport system substrate-binding protein
MFKKTLVCWVIISLIALTAIGCGTRKPSGCLERALLDKPETLNPLLTSGECVVLDYIFQGLIRYDEHLQLVGQLAERWDVSADNREWTFFLRKDVRWHDGEPFTARDVEFTFAVKAYDESFPGPKDKDFAWIEAIEIIDDYSIKFSLAEGHNLSMAIMCQEIVPRHLYDPQIALGRNKFSIRDMAKHPCNWQPVGTGPYRFREWQNQCIILERNDQYYDSDCPYIQMVKFNFFPDLDTALSALDEGRVDLLEGISYTQMETVPDLSETHEYYTYQEMGCQVLAFNFRPQAFGPDRLNPWLDRRVRQAVAWAINREGIIAELLGGRGILMNCTVPPKSWAYSPDFISYTLDLAYAGHLLDQAGWQENRDRWRYSGGNRLSFQLAYREDNPFHGELAAMVKEDLSQVGIEVILKPLAWREMLLGCLDAGNFEMALMGLSLDPDPQVAFLFGSGAFPSMNFGAYQNTVMDALVNIAKGSGDTEVPRAVYADMQKLISYDLPYIFLFSPVRTAIASNSLKGIVTSPLGLCRPEHWYFTGNKQRELLAGSFEFEH